MRLSGALPVHNDAFMLRYSLPALTKTNLDELVIVLDRCTDNSFSVISNWMRKCKPNPHVKVFVKQKQTWCSALADVFQEAFHQCTGDVIYSLAADCIYDPKIFFFDGNYDAICYSHVDRDPNLSLIRQNYEWFLQRLIRFRRVGTIYAIKRKVWEKLGGFEDHKEDWLWHRHGSRLFEKLDEQGYNYTFRRSDSIHLRAEKFTEKTQLRQGILRAKLKHPAWRVLLHSFVHIKPYVFASWLKEKENLRKENV